MPNKKYVWLKPALDSDHGVKEVLDNDKNVVWPLLSFSVGDVPRVSPAFIGHKGNPLLCSLFELLGFRIRDGEGWYIADLDVVDLNGPRPDGSKITYSFDSENLLHFKSTPAIEVIDHKPTVEVLSYFQSPKLSVSIAVNPDESANPLKNFNVTVEIQPDWGVPIRGIEGSLKLARACKVAFAWEDGRIQLKIGGAVAAITPHGVAITGGDATLGVESGEKKDKVIYLGVSCDPKASIDLPLGRNLPGSVKAKLTPRDMQLRFSRDGVRLATGAPTTREYFSVEFSLPLIEAKPESGGAAGISKILPLREADGKTPEIGLKAGVVFGHPGVVAPELPADPGLPLLSGPLLSMEKNGDSLQAPRFIHDALSVLAARVVSIGMGESGESVLKLISLGGSLGRLAGRARQEAAFTMEKVENRLSQGEELAGNTGAIWQSASRLPLPIALKADLKDSGALHFLATAYFDVWAGRLAENRVYFYCHMDNGAERSGGAFQWLDLEHFAVLLPSRNGPPAGDGAADVLATESDHDGYIDFKARELTIDYRRKSGAAPAPQLVIPGSLGDREQTPERFEEALTRRFRLQLDAFDPDNWDDPNPAPDKRIALRLGGKGLCVAARALPGGAATEMASNLSMSLVDRGEGAGRLVVVNNRIVFGRISAAMKVPGMKDLDADVDVAIRQDDAAKPPKMDARIALRKEGAIARLNLGVAKMRIEELGASLAWTKTESGSQWKLAAFASGDAWLTEDAKAPGGLDSLKKPGALRFDNIDLMNLHKSKGGVELKPDPSKPGRRNVIDFELLNGQFGVRARELRIDWDLPEKKIGFLMTRAEFEYRNPGQVDVAVQAGSAAIDIDAGGGVDVDLRFPSALGIDVTIGSDIRFRGKVGWFKDNVERFMAARGTVRVPGFPETTASFKLGVGVKQDGGLAPNIVLFGEQARDADLFGGAVLKRVGLGLGLNNRPMGFSAEPDPDRILAQLPTLDVADPFCWRFVREPGVFVMVLMRAMIGSNRGADSIPNLYLMELLLSLDTDLNAISAGKLWLFSSPNFVDRTANRARPLAMAAAVLRLRRQTLALVAETRPDPAMEKGEQLARLFDRFGVRLSTYISSEMADFYLERVSYQDNLLGMDVRVDGQYRFAAGRFGMLNRCSLVFQGRFDREFNIGVGGFSARGQVVLAGEFAGLITQKGIASYAVIAVDIDLRVKGWLYLPGIAWTAVKIRIVIPAVVITIRVPRFRRFRIKWKKKRIVISKRIEFEKTIQVPMPVLEKVYAPELRLAVCIAGGIGFDESMSLGFRGSIGVVICVCGFRKKLSVGLHFQTHVIDRVRQRVAAIESRLNRLRGLKAAPPLSIPGTETADSAGASEPPEWIYIRRVRGEHAYHLLLPAPESHWLAPNHHENLDDYANLPREWPTHEEEDDGNREIATVSEMEEASPLRNAVTRITARMDSGDEVELLMPWDRYNMDALAPGLSSEEAVSATRRISRLETLMLEGAVPVQDNTGINNEVRRRSRAGRLIADPRWETDNPRFLRLEARALPATVLSADFRPVEELLAGGVADASVGEADILERLRLYVTLRHKGLRQDLHGLEDMDEPDRLRDVRANLAGLMIQDLENADGPELFGEIEGVDPDLGSHSDDVDDDLKEKLTRWNIVSLPRRRFMPVLIGEGASFTLGAEVLRNTTGLEEFLTAVFDESAGSIELSMDIVMTRVESSGNKKEYRLKEKTLKITPAGVREDSIGSDPGFFMDEVPIHIEEFELDDGSTTSFVHGDEVCMDISLRVDPIEGSDLARRWGKLKEANRFPIFCRVVRKPPLLRSAGLIFKTNKNRMLDKHCVRVFRRIGGFEEETTIRVRPPGELHIRNVMFPLPPRQRMIETGEPTHEPRNDGEDPAKESRELLQMVLPVRLRDSFVEEAMPRLSHFAVYRTIGAEEPELLDDNVRPGFSEVRDLDGDYLLFGGVLMTDLFWVDRTDKGVELHATVRSENGRIEKGGKLAIEPGKTPVRYFARPVLYGDDEQTRDKRTREALFWPPASPFAPPRPLDPPSLALVLQADRLRKTNDDGHAIPFRPVPMAALADPEIDPAIPAEYRKHDLEVWAEQTPLPMDGFYGEGEEHSGDDVDQVQRAERLGAETAPPERTTQGKKLICRGGAYELDVKELDVGYGYRLYTRYRRKGELGDEADGTPRLVVATPIHLVRLLPEEMDAIPPGRVLGALELIGIKDWERGLRDLAMDETEDWLDPSRFTARRRILKKRIRDEEQKPATAPQPGVAFGCDVMPSSNPAAGIDGGVELVVQDVHESPLVFRQRSEVLGESSFRDKPADLRNPSRWCIPERWSGPAPADSSWIGIQPEEARDYDLIPFYVLAGEHNPVLWNFIDARNGLKEVKLLKDASQSTLPPAEPPPSPPAEPQPPSPPESHTGWDNWGSLHLALSRWFAAVDDHHRSPLSAGEEVDDIIDTMRLLARHVFMGLKAPISTDSDGGGAISAPRSNLEEAYKLIDAIREADVRQTEVRDDRQSYERVGRLLRLEAAGKRITGILMRRMALAEELFDPAEDGLQNAMLHHGRAPDKEKLPGEGEMNGLFGILAEEGEGEPSVLHRTLSDLKALLADDPVKNPAKDGLVKAIHAYAEKVELDGKISKALTGETGKRLAGALPQGAGLTAVVNSIKMDLRARGMELVRRPHHQLDPDAPEASLSSLLPEWIGKGGGLPPLKAFDGQAVESPEVNVIKDEENSVDRGANRRDGVVSLLNFFERLGFAVDVAAVDELGQSVPQERLIELVGSRPWKTLLSPNGADHPHRVILVTPREPDGDLAPGAAIGPSFLKLVVLPDALIDAMIGGLPKKTDENPDPKKRESFLKPWLELRGVKAPDADEAHLLERLFSEVRNALEPAAPSLPSDLMRLILEEQDGLYKDRPIRGGRVHGFWPFDGEAGHRFRVAVRRISRYEPLARWAAGLPAHRPKPLHGVPLDHPGCRKIVFQPAGTPDRKTEMFLPPAHHPRRPGFVYRLPPAGERAMLSGLSRVRTGFQGVDVRFFHEFADKNTFVNLNAAMMEYGVPPWVRLETQPAKTPSGELSLSLPKNSYNFLEHEEQIALFHFMDASGASHIRVRFKQEMSTVDGVETYIVHLTEAVELDWKLKMTWMVQEADDDAPSPLHITIQLQEVGKKEIIIKSGSRPLPMDTDGLVGRVVQFRNKEGETYARIISGYEPWMGRIAFNEALGSEQVRKIAFIYTGETRLHSAPTGEAHGQNPWLFRFEQLIIPENLPYYHDYWARAESRYASNEVSRSTPDEQPHESLEKNQGGSNKFRRRPARIGARPPLVYMKERELMVTLFLSRYEDHMTRIERHALRTNMPGFNDASKVFGQEKFGNRRLPDPHLRYTLSWRTTTDQGADGALYRPVVDLLPFSNEKPGEGEGGKFKVKCMMVNRGVEVERIVHIWRFGDDTGPIYQVNFTVDAEKDLLESGGGPSLNDASRLVMEVSRDGETPLVLVAEEAKETPPDLSLAEEVT